MFLVPAGLPGTRIIETWDHLGLRASGSHDVIFEDVVFPLDHEIDVRLPDEWRTPDFTQATVHAIFIAAIYDGVARAARDWLIGFLRDRVPGESRCTARDLAAGAGSARRHRGAAIGERAPDWQLRR
jgi:alkylation response protein AidB-like acyl-CoA dehydrogenase